MKQETDRKVLELLAREHVLSAGDAAERLGVSGASVRRSFRRLAELGEVRRVHGGIEELNRLTETLQKVSEQSERLTRDSEEMEMLNRTLTGICRVYEMQLKGASQQIGTIDQINEQSRKMAQLIEQLNGIYARMIEAMTVNMRAAAPDNAPKQ